MHSYILFLVTNAICFSIGSIVGYREGNKAASESMKVVNTAVDALYAAKHFIESNIKSEVQEVTHSKNAICNFCSREVARFKIFKNVPLCANCEAEGKHLS